jgi:hypothetical protein
LVQYEEGAITYVEFVRFVWSQVTEQDVLEHNQYFATAVASTSASWPFNG